MDSSAACLLGCCGIRVATVGAMLASLHRVRGDDVELQVHLSGRTKRNTERHFCQVV